VADVKQAKLATRSLNEPALFTGKREHEMHCFELRTGQVALATIGDVQKPRPNEDSAAIIPINDSHLVLAVADGVGGLAGARQASNLTVKALRKAIEQTDIASGASLRSAILDGIEAANVAVMSSPHSGASTLALAEIGPDYVRTYHVGDSILMVCGQRGAVKLQTTPHSPVGFAMEAGLINEKEALQHEELNLIFNVIGSADMRIEIGSEQALAPRDTLLLASDGLSDNLLQQEIVTAIRKGPLDAAIQAVTAVAMARMAAQQPGKPSKPDDYTTILFRRPIPRRKV
jgi:serine/threonine protein phosphatase PrpC